MKKNDIQKIKEKSDAELGKELLETQEEVRSLIFDLSSGKLKNYNQLREAKRKVARIMTFMVFKKHDKK